MKLVTWGVSLPYATVGGSRGVVTRHAFVSDSSTPICLPFVAGAPGELLAGGRAHFCHTCWRRVVGASWSTTSFKKGLLWVAKILSGDPFRDWPCASGIVDTEVEAIEAALAAIAAHLPSDAPVEISHCGEQLARKLARERRAEERAKKPGDGTDAQIVEFVYRHFKHWPSLFSDRWEWKSEQFKILRKTKKRVFVENTIGTYTTVTGATVLRTYSLDRAELERGKNRYGWTLNPFPPTRSGDGTSLPGWAAALGLELPCSLADAKRAFRTKAKAVHPDHGGSAEDFARVKSAFDAASEFLARSA